MLPNFVRNGEMPTADWANSVVSSLRSLIKPPDRHKKTLNIGGGAPANTCAFGSLVGGLSGSHIKGGIIHCGDKNFTVPNYEIDLGDNGRKLLYFEIECESNRDDDNEIFLPAVKTSAWEPAWEDTSSDEYPDNTHPVLATGLGTIIVPVGELIIASGSLSAFNATGCDNITISQCAGTLSYSRG